MRQGAPFCLLQQRGDPGHDAGVDLFRGAGSVDPVDGIGGVLGQLAKARRDRAVVIGAAPADRIAGIAIARGQPPGQPLCVHFEQERAIRAQRVAAKAVEILDRGIAQPPCPALIGAA